MMLKYVGQKYYKKFFLFRYFTEFLKISTFSSKKWNTIKHQIKHYIQHHIMHHIRKYIKFKIYTLVPSWKTIDHTIIFTQESLHPSFISKKNFALSMAEAFRKINFLPRAYQFSQWMRCAIFQINTDLLIS